MKDLLTAPDMIHFVYTGIALGSFLLFTGLYQLFRRGESGAELRNRRMRMIARGSTTAEILALLKPDRPSGPLSRLPLLGDLPRLLRQAGLTMVPEQFVLLCLAVGLVALVGSLAFVGPVLSILIGAVLGLVLPAMVIRSRAQKRSDALVAQLPDALDLLARGLRVGHPLNTSIKAVADDMADPIGTEFGIIFDQVSYGDDLVDAFQELAERVDLEDVHYLSASIGIQHGTGGDLARVVQVLSKVVRGRIAMRRRILAISSEGRLTAVFLSSLPVLIYLFTSYSAPHYYRGVSEDPMFMPMAATVIGFTALNYFALRRLVNFRI